MYSVKYLDDKLCFEMKSTKLGVDHITSISGHFFANFINSFHKTEVLIVILMGPTLGCANKDLWELCAPIFTIVVYSRTATSYFWGAKE